MDIQCQRLGPLAKTVLGNSFAHLAMHEYEMRKFNRHWKHRRTLQERKESPRKKQIGFAQTHGGPNYVVVREMQKWNETRTRCD